MDSPLILVYLLANDSALISNNHPITVEFDNNKYTYNGTYLIKKNKKTDMRRFTSTAPARDARAPNRAISNSCL